MGSMSSRRHSVERPSSPRRSRWFGTMSRVRANQKADRPVRTLPLSGISVGSTTSNVEMRSLATSSRRSSSSAYNSRTLPLPTWTTASGMSRFLLLDEGAQAVEHGVDVRDGRARVEGCVECVGVELRADLGVGPDERAEVALLVPRGHSVALDDAVGVTAVEPRLDEGEQHTVREHEPVRRVEVPCHPFGIDD